MSLITRKQKVSWVGKVSKIKTKPIDVSRPYHLEVSCVNELEPAFAR